MDYEDYKREWTVITEGAAECPIGSTVTFEGPDNLVTVRCGEDTPYGENNGMYKRESNTIEVGDYVIRMVRCVQLMPKAKGPIAGSWTAEDQGPWPGDG